jgi:Capsule polysaccharide biosynthesis protein
MSAALNPSASAHVDDEPKRVVVHCFGEYGVLYYHLFDLARTAAAGIAFHVIVPTSHHYDLICSVVPRERVLCLEFLLDDNLDRDVDTDALAGYVGSIHADIEAEKRTLKYRKARQQMVRAVDIYKIYKHFVETVRPHHVLLAHVESYEQRMLESLCHELGVPVSVPIDIRTLSGSIFCADTRETLPMERPVNETHVNDARALVTAFREAHLPALKFPIPEAERGKALPIHIKPFAVRLKEFLQRSLRHPSQFEWDFLKAAVLNNLPVLRDSWWALLAWRARSWHDLDRIEGLPSKFIYYPLQVTPESSINTPAPYYVDQERVVDLLRMNMPSDHTLVVKEHRALFMLRSKRFMDRLRRKSGVLVVHNELPAREIIKRAAVTISVTGTSTLEAFLLGKPSLTLGPMFLSEFLGGVAGMGEIRDRIRHAIDNPPDDRHIVRSIAEVLSLREPCSIFHVNQPGSPAHTEANIRNLLAALRRQMELRSKTYADQGAQVTA